MCNSISVSAHKARVRSLNAVKAGRKVPHKFKGAASGTPTLNHGLKVLSEAAFAVQEKASLSSDAKITVKRRPLYSRDKQQRRTGAPLPREKCEEIVDNIFGDMDSSFFFPPQTAASAKTKQSHTLAPVSRTTTAAHHNDNRAAADNQTSNSLMMNFGAKFKAVRFTLTEQTPHHASADASSQPIRV